MSEINIDGQVYKEVKIKRLVINGVPQSGTMIGKDQLKAGEQLQVTIETEAPEQGESSEKTNSENEVEE